MSSSLAFHHLGRPGGANQGSLVPQSMELLNCRFDITQATVKQDYSGSLKTPFKATGSEADYGIREGELLFSMEGGIGAGHPAARSALNNIAVPAMSEEEAVSIIDAKMVLLGFSTKTCSVNSMNMAHTDAPVAAVGGLMTVPNFCGLTTMTGDILIQCMPSKGDPSHMPRDGMTSMTAMRVIVPAVPLRHLMDPTTRSFMKPNSKYRVLDKGKCAMVGTSSHLKRALKKILALHDLVTGKTVAKAEDLVNMGGGDDLFTGPSAAALKGAWADTTYEQTSENMMGLLVKSEGADAGKPTQVLAELLDDLLPLSMLLSQLLMLKKVARVTRGAPHGMDHDISIEFGLNGSTGKFVGGF